MASENSLEDKHIELLRRERQVNKLLESQVGDGAAELEASKATLAREVEKLIRLDADPDIFKAIARAAWEAPDSADFAKLAKVTEAKVRLQVLTGQHGPPKSFRDSLNKEEQALENKEKKRAELKERIVQLESQLTPVVEYNERASRAYALNAGNREKIEQSGWFGRLDNQNLSSAYGVFKEYGKKNGVTRGQSFYAANCFEDMEELASSKDEYERLGPDIEFSRDKHYQKLAAYKEVRDAQRVIADNGAEEETPVDLDTFQQELCKRLNDDAFIRCFANSTASGVGGDIILSALATRIRQKVQDDLVAYYNNVKEMTALIEGPIGILAKNSNRRRSIDLIGQDIKSQALMAGYLCECAAMAFKSLASFRPDHTEGPVSLTRDLQMHMVVNDNVDPAYIHEVLGMDRLLMKHFNVSARRPQPNFEEVLSKPNNVERINRRFAKFLRDNAADEQIKADGFAAGQFSTESIELFLLKRYFVASATKEDVLAALQQEADEVTKIGDEREELGIPRNGPELPGIK